MGRLNTHSTGCLIVDIQEKLAPAMLTSDELIAATVKLCRGMGVLGVPMMITEQYPRGLGHTLPSVLDAASGADVVEKTRFSGAVDTVLNKLRDQNAQQVVLAGIETHVCLQQTALDLLGAGYEVVVCADACSSRAAVDRDLALARMRHAGIVVTSVESVLFELLRDAKSPHFKAMLDVVK